MLNFSHILRRSDDESYGEITPTMTALLAVLMVLVGLAVIAVIILLVLRNVRRKRKAQAPGLPLYNEKRTSTSSRSLTITTSNSDHGDSAVYSEKQILMDKGPDSPVPEIRITFPEEVDASGKRQSGRVVVVRVGETSIGLEPYNENLPPYQREHNTRFQSLDLDRIGGLKEKNMDIAV